jgi:hypothetical protein
MPDKTKYILSHRPRTYWNSAEARLSTPRGTFRTPEQIDDTFDEITDPVMREIFRKLIANADQLLMRGVYLPDYMEGEEEIVRIALDNNEVDTWSVRAKEEEGIIKYRVVDEYETK